MSTTRPFLAIAAVLVAATASATAQAQPDATGPGWTPLFAADLSNADKPADVWSVANGELTANADHSI